MKCGRKNRKRYNCQTVCISLIVLIIYTTHNSARFSYIAETILRIAGIQSFAITNDIDEYKQSIAPSVNYSDAPVKEGEVWLAPQGLLSETSIRQQPIQCFTCNTQPAFFETMGDMPFDIFAASFYLLSRYEEYLPHEKDAYGRYAHNNSLAYQQGFLHLPVVNIWLVDFVKLLKEKFPALSVQPNAFRFQPTYDIDIAYSYLHQPFLKNLGGFYKDLFTGQWKQLAERANVYSGWRKDPFDTYDWLDELHSQFHLQPIYFFLLAAQRKGVDKNVPPNTKAMQELVKRHAEKYTTGIHPSWQSGDSEKLLAQEIALLQAYTGQAVTRSRQHYVRMHLPGSYRILLQQGIQEDYSMGYGSINGFRASVASAFFWYDLEKEQQTTLQVWPFCWMEANAVFEQGYTAEQGFEELQQYHNVVKQVNGILMTLEHNHFVTEQPQWVGWRNGYKAFLQRNFG